MNESSESIESSGMEDSLLSQPSTPQEEQGSEPEQSKPDSEFYKNGKWHGKYKTDEELAKGYNELRKQLGGFTGAPESYEIKLADEFNNQFHIDQEDPFFQSFAEFGKENNFSQDMFNNLINLYAHNISKLEKEYAQSSKEFLAAEREKLGEKAGELIQEVHDWAKSNVPTEFADVVSQLGQTADGVRFLKMISERSHFTKVPVDGNVNTLQTSQIESQLRDMMADRRYGQDPDFTKMVDAQYANHYG